MSASHTSVRAYLAGVVLVVGLAACAGGGDPQAFCDQLAAIGEEISAAPEFDDDPDGFREAGVRLRPLLTEARDSAPDDIAADFDLMSARMITFIDAVDTAEGEELEALVADFFAPDAEFGAAFDNVDAYAQTECGFDLT